MNKDYAAVCLFFLAKKIKPKATNPNIMAKPTPIIKSNPESETKMRIDCHIFKYSFI